ncbi:voltage-gated purine nucleotide uniporter SLC17A9 [Anolis carolinensis]|uniref:Voltage-gated purine nucleotide uniporter SLC17A9 n=1 Tax=Anolis carolinensis TaxID=28377 RepID=G1KE80_ANOCA|nr:PREDICTED: solute carrier family 17 member 9 [Anolis carolinensis]|eukprot:XP_008108385.1 PREDICTED: solute carrier family 17 member 9 [Anolis carolinensis]
MALGVSKNGTQVYSDDLLSLHHHKYQQLQPARCGHHPHHEDSTKKDGIQDTFWSRPESRIWTLTLLLGTCLLYCTRVTMPICVVAMSAHFGWDKKQSGVVLSSFFWGYCVTQIIGGHLSDRIGGEKVLLLSATAWGCITAITPLFIYVGSAHLVLMTFSRFFMGLFQGVHFPALASLFSRKVRENERSFTYSTVGTGSQFGTLVMGAAGSLLLDWYGWETVFYFSGLLTLLWVYCMCKYLLNEKEIIIPLEDLVKGLSLSKQTKVPWKQIFKKAPVWAVIVAQLCAASTFFTLLSWLPTFFTETFPDSKGWIFNVVPWLVAIPTSLFSGFLSDQCINQGYKPITIRKFMQIVGLGISSIFALGIGYTSSFCQAVVFASACIGFQTFNHSGISVNIQDLAPSCAGLLFGVANTGGALLGVVCVYLAGHLIESTGSWVSVFNLVATVNAVGLCTFLIFGKAHRVDTDNVYVDL